jgi:hypothetical protein
MPAVSTRNARVQVALASNPADLQTILGTRWTVDVHSDEIDVTNFESGGFTQHIPSYVEASISVDGFYEPIAFPFVEGGVGGSALVAAGEFLYIKLFATRANANDYFLFPKALVLTAHAEASVRDAVRVSFTAKNYGTFTYPGSLVFNGIETTT